MRAPDWSWEDMFGDKLEVHEGGSQLILSIVPKNYQGDEQIPAVALTLDQIRGLRAALGVHCQKFKASA